MRNFGSLGGSMSMAGRQRNPILDQLVQTLKVTGYTDMAAEEIALALGTLANYGVLSLTGGSLLGNLMNLNRLSLHGNAAAANGSAGTAGQATSSSSSTNQSSTIAPLINSSGNGARSGEAGYAGTASSEDSVALLRQLTDTLARNKGGAATASTDYYGSGVKADGSADSMGMFNSGSGMYGVDGTNMSGYGAQPAGSPEPQETEEIQVAENMAGAIIGQQGRGITEINQLTGATVQVSRRGVYAPGTTNRVVTIQGSGSAVSRAALVVRHKISEAESRSSSRTSY